MFPVQELQHAEANDPRAAAGVSGDAAAGHRQRTLAARPASSSPGCQDQAPEETASAGPLDKATPKQKHCK